MILLHDVTATEQVRARQDDAIARLTARTRDMAEANRALLAANQSLTGTSVAAAVGGGGELDLGHGIN
jgi:hypothetical protein